PNMSLSPIGMLYRFAQFCRPDTNEYPCRVCEVAEPRLECRDTFQSLVALVISTDDMAAEIQLHNSMGGKKEAFTPLKPDAVRIYTCGPTVYDFAHIGNFRTFMFQDLL